MLCKICQKEFCEEKENDICAYCSIVSIEYNSRTIEYIRKEQLKP